MKPRYRIYVRDPVPDDLKERIAAIHAAAIMKGNGGAGSIACRKTGDPYGAAQPYATPDTSAKRNARPGKPIPPPARSAALTP